MSCQPHAAKLAQLAMLVSAASLLLACSSSTTRADVVGKYVCRFPEGVAELELKPDGNFDQSFAEPSGKVVLRNSGSWAFAGLWPELRIELKEYVVVHNKFGDYDYYEAYRPGARGNYSYNVGRWFGGVYLSLHPDTAWHFDKVR